MIKRRFYKQDHGDKSGTSDSSSSEDSDSDLELETEEDRHVEEEESKGINEKAPCYPSPGSGYESEDSSNNQGETDGSGLLTNEEEGSDEEDLGNNKDRKAINKKPDYENERAPEMAEITYDPNDPIQAEISNFILKFKNIFRCRLCPRVLCLNEDTVREHLKSKGHGRSKKLLGEGRLKLMLNSDGELEEEQETHAERHARTLALAEKSVVLKKKTGRQRQSHRRKKRMRNSKKENSEASVENTAKKRCRMD